MLSPILACASVPKAIEYYTQKLGFELEYTRTGYINGLAFHYLRKALS